MNREISVSGSFCNRVSLEPVSPLRATAKSPEAASDCRDLGAKPTGTSLPATSPFLDQVTGRRHEQVITGIVTEDSGDTCGFKQAQQKKTAVTKRR